jgi:hypothetical protein
MAVTAALAWKPPWDGVVACFVADAFRRGDDAACSLGVGDMESALLSGLELGSAGVGNSFRAMGLRVDIVACDGGG